ncbi:hypothetical protein HU200_067410 [Digitaria exilis]|uniref:Uncharacterized protein n=1 Tax=Digitaria exilis TaxID=1010633 RepID=A0A834ZYM8_9POAL|nr:hypothetical protein HU200_067410 [Digitaria exilis]CAB3479504.1 unnamed protein product [Digitaria exilis]
MVVLAWGCFFLLAACARALRRVFQLPALLCCEAMVWAISFLAFPLRMLTAVDRERKLGGLIGEMQAQMDHLVWANRDLEDKLQAALRERGAMEALLDEMEDEQDDAFAKIDALQTQVKALRQENMRLNEHKGKSMWDKHGDDGSTKAAAAPESSGATTKQAARSPRVASGRERGEEEEEAMKKAAMEDQGQARAVARRRSVFSVGMSVAVGGVAWSADAACLPLLAGLFAVVGVSMRSVSRLRRGADAVALLSLNWFLLGLLTSPMLPALAHALLPRALVAPALTPFAATPPVCVTATEAAYTLPKL